MQPLAELVHFLERHPAVREKACIHHVYAAAEGSSGTIPLGDDCAAIPDPSSDGHLLFAAEGMLDSFVESDPWFAGYSAVMVNLSDVAAMGGTPIAITDVLATPDMAAAEEIWSGMRAASSAYGVPVVGGHTTFLKGGSPRLSAAVLGRAGKNLLTSFDAEPGDFLVLAIDMRAAYRGDKPFWNASVGAPPERLQADLALLPEIARRGLSKAAKDVSNGGIIGTLAMLAHCSDVAALLDLDALPRPSGTTWEKWLISFPSYGYLLAAAPGKEQELISIFENRGIAAVRAGRFTTGSGIRLESGGQQCELDFRV